MSLLKNISVIASGSVVSQIIGAVSIWLLSHKYNMSAVGDYALTYSIILIGAQFCTYGTHFLLPKQEEKLLVSNIVYATLQSIIVALIYTFFIILFFEKGALLIYFLTLAHALILISENLLLRSNKIKELAYQRLSITLFVMLSILATGNEAHFYTTWVIGLSFIICGWVLYSVRKLKVTKQHFSIENNYSFFKENLKHISGVGSAEVLAMVNNNLPIMLITFWFTPIAAGYFAVVSRFCLAPVIIVGNAVRNSIFSKWSIDFREGSFNFLEFKKVRLLLLVLAILSVGGVALFYPLVMRFAFSSEWQDSIPTAYYMLPYLFPAMAICPLTIVELIYGTPRYFLQIQIEQLLVIGIAFVVFPYFYLNYDWSILIYSVLSFVRYSFIYIKVNKRANSLNNERVEHAG